MSNELEMKVCEAASDYIRGHYDFEFADMNGGLAKLEAILEQAVRNWEDSFREDSQ